MPFEKASLSNFGSASHCSAKGRPMPKITSHLFLILQQGVGLCSCFSFPPPICFLLLFNYIFLLMVILQEKSFFPARIRPSKLFISLEVCLKLITSESPQPYSELLTLWRFLGLKMKSVPFHPCAVPLLTNTWNHTWCSFLPVPVVSSLELLP